MKSHWGARTAAVALSLLGLLASAGSGTDAVAETAPQRDAFGVVLAGRAPAGATAAERVALVGSTWYYDYSARLDDEPAGFHKVGMLRCGEDNRADLAYAAAQARSRPGHAWLLCNEPDLVGQDAVSDAFLQSRGELRSQYYARVVGAYARAIKTADPTARLVGPNLFNADGQGIAWLSSVQAAYAAEFGQGLPFDVLGIHLYAFDKSWKRLPQVDLRGNERFLAQTLEFASLLPDRPPVWVTEVGSMWIYRDVACRTQSGRQQCQGTQTAWDALSLYTEQLVSSMSAAGVERWFFFSTNPAPDPWASVPNATFLADEAGRLTPAGQAWLAATPSAREMGWATKVLQPPVAIPGFDEVVSQPAPFEGESGPV